MRLCSDRPEGFGPISHRYSNILTSCFLDTILVPLCTWLYLLVILLLGICSVWRLQYSKGTGNVNDEYKPRRSRGKLGLGLKILYSFIIVALLAMASLEIARLARADLGIGLLPFTFVSLLIAAVLRLTEGLGKRVAGWRWANLGLWLALAATNSVKIAQEAKEGAGARKGTQYPESDQITDVGVMIGLYVILAALEVFLPAQVVKNRRYDI